MTSTPGPQADRGRRSQVLRLRVRAACPQLWLFPSFNEVDGPRHASCETVSPSNLGRPPMYGPILRTRNPHCTSPRRSRQTFVVVEVAARMQLDLADRPPR